MMGVACRCHPLCIIGFLSAIKPEVSPSKYSYQPAKILAIAVWYHNSENESEHMDSPF